MIESRSPILLVVVRAASPLALVVAMYLFFGGHNRPGGGFAAGLVLGAVVALRTVAGLPHLARATTLLVAGALVSAAVALVPLFAGRVVLDQVVVDVTIPLLGTVKSGSALLFDAGVTLIVVGLVVAVLDGLGASAMTNDTSTSGGER